MVLRYKVVLKIWGTRSCAGNYKGFGKLCLADLGQASHLSNYSVQF